MEKYLKGHILTVGAPGIEPESKDSPLKNVYCVHYPPIQPQHLNTNKSIQVSDVTTGRKCEEQKPKYKLQMTKTAEFAGQ